MADFPRLSRKLDKTAQAIRDDLPRALLRGGLIIAKEAQRNVTGPRPEKLGVVTGRLRSSIVVVSVGRFAVKVGTNVIYGAIHEHGGIIRPRKGKWLRFKTEDGVWHTVARVVIPKRPWLKPAAESKREAARDEIRKVWRGPLRIAGRLA